MGTFMVQTANTIWRDYNTDGVPSSEEYDPKKADIRAWGTWVESIITAFTANGGLVYTLRASLDAQLSRPPATMAWVIGDPVVDNNGIYQKIGVEGTGSWNRVADLPFSFIIASDVGAGTPNAIQATTSIPVSGSALVWMNVFEANTASPVTVSFNGGSALTIKTNSGNDVAAGGLTSGMIVMGIVSGSTFRLVSDLASAALVAQAEAAATVAVAAASSIATYATRAVAAAQDLSGVSDVTISRWSSSSRYAPATYQKVSSEPAHAAKFQSADGAWWEISGDVIHIRSLGAICDGTTNDTSAVVLAGSQDFAGKEIRFPAADIVVEGTIPVYSTFVAVPGMATFKQTLAGGTDMNGARGFAPESNGGMHFFRFERGVTAGAISGEFNNAVVVGQYATTGKEYTNIHLSNLEFVGVDAGVGRRSIFGIYGNVHDCTFKNFKYSGFISYAMMIHWGGNFDPTAPDTGAVTQSWHPRRLLIDGVFFENPLPDAALGCVYVSGGHNIDCRNVFASGVRIPIVVAAGDVGGLVAQGDSVGQVLKNIVFDNCTIKNYEIAGVQLSGASGTRAGALWLAINEGSLVTFNNLVIERGPLSSTNTRAFDCRLMTGVRVNGIDVSHGTGASTSNFTPAVFLQACDDFKLSGKTVVPFAHELVGCGKKIELDTVDICLRTDYNTSCIGTRLTGQSAAHTLGAALTVGATSVTLTSLSFDVVAGSTINVGGRTMVLTKAAMQSTDPVTLSITPSFVAAASGAGATVEKYTGDIEHTGYAEGFHTGYQVNNSSSGRARKSRIRGRHFRRSGLYDVQLRAARRFSVEDCEFTEGGQLDNSSCVNIRMTDGCSHIKIRGNSFENNPDDSTKMRHNIYLFGDTVGAIVTGNEFHNAQTSAINKFAPSNTADEDHIIADNWWGPLLPAGATGRVSGTAGYYSTTVGDRRIGYSSAAPATGSWRQGDILWDTGAAASGKAGRICVAAGSPGTWKMFAAIDA
jgi:hypothetical protein